MRKNFYKNLQMWRKERGNRKQQANRWRQEGYHIYKPDYVIVTWFGQIFDIAM
jgi:hypothetical protein